MLSLTLELYPYFLIEARTHIGNKSKLKEEFDTDIDIWKNEIIKDFLSNVLGTSMDLIKTSGMTLSSPYVLGQCLTSYFNSRHTQ